MSGSEDNEKPFVCGICGKGFPQETKLQRHHRYHTGEAPFLCTICDKTFIQANSLKAHLRIHSGKKAFVCKTCGSSFTQESSLRRHRVLHGEQLKPSVCKLCGKNFPNRAKLRRHESVHTGIKAFSCDVCGNAFTQESSLKRHRLVHSDETNEPGTKKDKKKVPQFSTCSEVSPTLSDLKNHNGTGDKKPFVCDVCGKSFTRASNLRKHDRKHTGEKPYSCVCGRAFSTKSKLECHQLKEHGDKEPTLGNSHGDDLQETHPECQEKPSFGDKPVTVAVQEKNVEQKTNARTKLQVTSSKAKQAMHGSHDATLSLEDLHLSPLKVQHPFRDFCCEVFSHKWNLERYQRIHFPEKPYACDSCGKAYPYMWTLECHMRSHTEPKQPFFETHSQPLTQETQRDHQNVTHTMQEPSGCDQI